MAKNQEAAPAEVPVPEPPASEASAPETPSTETSAQETAAAKSRTLKSIGEDVLAAHPEFSSVYVTADGYVFPVECDAINYAVNLKNKKIVTVTRK